MKVNNGEIKEEEKDEWNFFSIYLHRFWFCFPESGRP